MLSCSEAVGGWGEKNLYFKLYALITRAISWYRLECQLKGFGARFAISVARLTCYWLLFRALEMLRALIGYEVQVICYPRALASCMSKVHFGADLAYMRRVD